MGNGSKKSSVCAVPTFPTPYRKISDMLVTLNTLLRRAMVSAHVAPQTGRSGAITPPVLAMGILTIGSLCALLLLPRITQDQSYHEFVDQRTLLGIPNFWNVISNVPFIMVGAAGLRRFYHDPATVVLFLGIFLTGFGSSYYHWNPNDSTLFWDRLPMTLCFMAILAIAVEERVNARAGAALLWPLLAIGVFSLLLWYWTDDLRLYIWVQFFPCLALPLLFLWCPPKYTGTFYWVIAAALYALAKLFEFYDRAVFSAGSVLSGHTLKHLTAAAACFAILRYFQTRRLIA
jgi:Ceramidase